MCGGGGVYFFLLFSLVGGGVCLQVINDNLFECGWVCLYVCVGRFFLFYSLFFVFLGGGCGRLSAGHQ